MVNFGCGGVVMLQKVLAGSTALIVLVLTIVSFIDIDLFHEMWLQAFQGIVLIGILVLFASLFTTKK